MPIPPAEQDLPLNHRPQQASTARIRPCYRDRQASVSSQPGILRVPVPLVVSGRPVPQNRYTSLPFTSRQATPVSASRTAIPGPATTIERSDIRILTDQFKSFSANQSSLSIVEIGGRSHPLTKENLDKLLQGYGVWDAHIEELVAFEGPAMDRLRMRVTNWQDSVKLASRESEFGVSFLEFRT